MLLQSYYCETTAAIGFDIWMARENHNLVWGTAYIYFKTHLNDWNGFGSGFLVCK